MEIDFEVAPDAGCESFEEMSGAVASAADAAAEVAAELNNQRLSVSAILVGDDAIRELNYEWRGRDKATNVLSFPMVDRGTLLSLSEAGPPVFLGDLAFGCGILHAEAAEKRISLADHLAHLTVHGLLHLAGYDHEAGDREADAMETLEIAALAKLGIANPYGDRN